MIKKFLFYSSKFLKILTKSAEVVPFELNFYQRRIEEEIRKLEEAGLPVRILILKCRQVGGSTFGAAYGFQKVATNFFRKAVVIAHDDKSTSNLFNMCKRFYDYLPIQVRPMKRYSNEKALVFENPDEGTRDENPGLRSSIHVENANNPNAGRSSTVQHLLCSEMAFWKNAGKVITGLFQSVPNEPGTSIIIESTGNGVAGEGEEFYLRCMKALKGEGNFVFIFCKWTDNPEYEMEPPPDFEMTEEEIKMVELHPELTPRKLAWRRYKIENEMGETVTNPKDQFKQEYPLTPEEAFITTGRPVFDIEVLNADIERARSIPFKRGEFENGRFVETKTGNFRLYKEPVEGEKYAIGGDVAEGLEEGDFSTQFVINKKLEQMASYHGHTHPDLFGGDMIAMGDYFNKGLLAPEVNNHGLTTLTHITNKSYPFIYMRQVLDERTNEYTAKAGWQTNKKTKILMLDEFAAAYRKREIRINDVELLMEMRTLSKNADGSVNLNGKDRVVGACIALQAVKQLPANDTGAYDSSEQKKTYKSLEEMLKATTYDTAEESYFD